MSVKLLYHSNCADGIFSAFYANKQFPDADAIAMRYQEQLPPILDGDKIVCVDYCPDLTVLKNIEPASLLVIDHHKTTHEELEGFVPHYPFSYIYDNDECGTSLVWKYFHPGEPEPWVIPYVKDRDLWQWKLWKSKEVDACFHSYPFTLQNCQALIDMGVEHCVVEGTPIIRYQGKIIRQACAQAREIDFMGHKVMSVNSTVLASEIGHELGKGRPFAIVWFNQDKIKRFVYSLRSDNDTGIDVGAIAQAYGGGGHFHAASFSAPWHMEYMESVKKAYIGEVQPG
jgi:oligoribonuclease NrnB/cAMP/cGMP phosphodiesterase (DHH superfamily)